MCGRGEGRGNGKRRAAPSPRAESPDEALVRRLENMLERFLNATSELRRRGDTMEATLVRLEQYVEQMIDQQEELVQQAFAVERQNSGRRSRP